jgi:hypothetical protein
LRQPPRRDDGEMAAEWDTDGTQLDSVGLVSRAWSTDLGQSEFTDTRAGAADGLERRLRGGALSVASGYIHAPAYAEHATLDKLLGLTEGPRRLRQASA